MEKPEWFTVAYSELVRMGLKTNTPSPSQIENKLREAVSNKMKELNPKAAPVYWRFASINYSVAMDTYRIKVAYEAPIKKG